MNVNFWLEEIDDPYIRDNFKRLQDSLKKEPRLKGDFTFFEIIVPSATVNHAYLHNLTFVPKDVILLSVSNGADVTFHYSSFTNNNIYFTTTAACTIRAFVGSYTGGSN